MQQTHSQPVLGDTVSKGLDFLTGKVELHLASQDCAEKSSRNVLACFVSYRGTGQVCYD